MRVAKRGIDLIDGIEIGDERTFDVDHHLLIAGQADDEVGAQTAILDRHRYFLAEIDEGRQARRFDQILELLFAPATPRLGRGAQRIDELGGFFADLPLSQLHLVYRLAQFGVAADAILLDPLEAFLIAFERRFDRGQQRLELRLALLVRLGKPLVGPIEEGLLRFPQQLAANFAELGRQLLFGVAKRHDLRFEGFRPRLRIRLERRQVAQGRLALGLRGVEPLGKRGLRRFQPLRRCRRLRHPLLLHRQFADRCVALTDRHLQPARKVGFLRHQRAKRLPAQQPANRQPDEQRNDNQQDRQDFHEQPFWNEKGT